MNLDSKTIAITGAAGFIGSNLVKYFGENHPNAHIIAIDCFRAPGSDVSLGHFRNMKLFPNVEVVALDINDFNMLKNVFKRNKIYAFFHNAAISDTTCTNDKLVMSTNYTSFKGVAYLALTHRSHLIYASSAAVYGGNGGISSVGKHESPLNIYGFSKLCDDQEMLRVAHKFQRENLSIIGLRYFNVYGHGEFYKGRTASMILQLALQALKNGEANLFEFGEQKRDFVYIKDVVNANVAALSNAYHAQQSGASSFDSVLRELNGLDLSANAREFIRKFIDSDKFASALRESVQPLSSGASGGESGAVAVSASGIFNVGSGKPRSYNDIVRILEHHLGFEIKINYIKNPYSFFQNYTHADANDFVPNYSPAFDLEAGISDYIDEIKSISQGQVC